jgi:hypothetical protein
VQVTCRRTAGQCPRWSMCPRRRRSHPAGRARTAVHGLQR